MLRSIYLFILLLFLTHLSVAQALYDAKWILGTNLEKGVILDFLQDSVTQTKFALQLPVYVDAATISDTRGNLVAYSNGCEIADKNHKIMSNGEEINPGKVHDNYCSIGYPMVQGMLFLPHPSDSNLYILFHEASNIESGIIYSYPLYQTIIDKSKNNNAGEVILKNNPILKDTLVLGQLTATKHANGNDWWIIAPKLRSNIYYKLLFTSKGIVKIDTQAIGTKWLKGSSTGAALFNQKGTLYARGEGNQKIHLFNFDRCSGKFSNLQTFDHRDSIMPATGLAFSPNSRFLYVTTGKKIYQFDVQANDIDKSRILIDTYDGFENPLSTKFFICQLALNNKIYIGATNGVKNLHTIHRPDSLGTKCDFKQHDVSLPVQYFGGIPQFPNYRLGAADIICPIVAEENIVASLDVRIFPNPASETLTIEVPSSPLATTVTICTSLGQVVYKNTVQQNTELNVQDWGNGLYFCMVRQGERQMVKKVVVQREE